MVTCSVDEDPQLYSIANTYNIQEYLEISEALAEDQEEDAATMR